MARMLPTVIDTHVRSPGEREVFERLRSDPGTKDWVVLHSLDIAQHRRQVSGEADFVVIIPERGVLVLEVKASESLHRNDEGWWFGRASEPDRRGPFKQASEAMHSLRGLVTRQAPELSGVVFWSAVIFTHVEFKSRSVEWHPWQVIDAPAFRRTPISDLLLHVIDSGRRHLAQTPQGRWFDTTARVPSPHHVNLLVDIFRPAFEFFEPRSTRAARQDDEVKHFTREQFAALDHMMANDRVLFTGPAGTGKTLLAIEATRRAAQQGRRTLFLCFNNLLGRWLEGQTEDLRPSVVTRTIHAHMLHASRKSAPRDPDPAFWMDELPAAAIETLLEDQSVPFDELVIDEAQDMMRPAMLDFLDLSVVGGLSAGRWRMFGDFERQAIFAKEGQTSDVLEQRSHPLVRYGLRENCRNTPRIAEYAMQLGGLDPGYATIRRPDDRVEPDVRFYADATEQERLLCEALGALYENGYRGADIIVLSPKARDSAAVLLRTRPWSDRLAPAGDRSGMIPFTTVHAFKGCEAPAVVITDIESFGAYEQSLFYIGVTRALHRLTILISADAKNEVARLLLGGRHA